MNNFQLNIFSLLVPFILIPYTLTMYVLSANTICNCVKILFRNIVLKIISNIFVLSNVLNCFFIFGTQHAQYKKIQRLAYRTRNLYENFCHWLPCEDVNYLPHLIKFTFKAIVFSVAQLMYMTLSVSLIAPEVSSYFIMPGLLIPIFVNKLYPDLHYGALLVANFHFDQINREVKRIVSIAKASNDLAKANSCSNEIELRDSANHLETICLHYIELIEIVKEINRIMGTRVVLWLLLGLCNFLIHLFMEYLFVGIPIRYGHSLNFAISASGMFELCLQFSEFWFTTSVCSGVVQTVYETEMILSSVYVKFHVNDPFMRSVNSVHSYRNNVLKNIFDYR